MSVEDNEALISRFLDIVVERGGVLAKIERWGARKLAYPIKKQLRGYYALLEVIADSAVIDELERLFRIEEMVLRYLTVILQETVSAADVEEAKMANVTLATASGASIGENVGKEPMALLEEAAQETKDTDITAPKTEIFSEEQILSNTAENEEERSKNG